MRKTPKYRDYPASICSASSAKIWPEMFTATSKQMNRNVVTDSLRAEFVNKLGGEVGDISPITNSKNPIGQCSEQHSANDLLKDHPTHILDDIEFSICLRPRTMEYVPTCDNCSILFASIQ